MKEQKIRQRKEEDAAIKKVKNKIKYILVYL